MEIGCESVRRCNRRQYLVPQNVDKFGYVVDVATESDLIDEVVPEIG
jgi:hypothetical protein